MSNLMARVVLLSAGLISVACAGRIDLAPEGNGSFEPCQAGQYGSARDFTPGVR